MPVFNGALYLKACIDSVLNQTYSDFELIIVDNQSTDDTVAIIKSYSDSRIKFFQNDSNIGLIPNWNMAISKASGTYIKLLPADDIIYPTCLEKQVAVLDRDIQHKIAMVCAKKHVINEKGKVILSRGFASRELEVSGFEAISKNMRSGGNIIGEGGTVLFRKSLFDQVGPFNSPLFYVLDIDQWYKLLLHGNLYYQPDILGAFRVSASSGSTKARKSQNSDLRTFMKRIYSEKQYKVTWLSYQIGLFKAALSTLAKRLLYKFVIKD